MFERYYTVGGGIRLEAWVVETGQVRDCRAAPRDRAHRDRLLALDTLTRTTLRRTRTSAYRAPTPTALR